jgi:hypothetical protein
MQQAICNLLRHALTYSSKRTSEPLDALTFHRCIYLASHLPMLTVDPAEGVRLVAKNTFLAVVKVDSTKRSSSADARLQHQESLPHAAAAADASRDGGRAGQPQQTEENTNDTANVPGRRIESSARDEPGPGANDVTADNSQDGTYTAGLLAMPVFVQFAPIVQMEPWQEAQTGERGVSGLRKKQPKKQTGETNPEAQIRRSPPPPPCVTMSTSQEDLIERAEREQGKNCV